MKTHSDMQVLLCIHACYITIYITKVYNYIVMFIFVLLMTEMYIKCMYINTCSIVYKLL